MHVVKILFNSSDFYSIISAVLLVSGSDQQSHIKNKMEAMIAANMEVTWKNVLSSIDNLLMETEIQDNNSDFRVPRSDISPQQTRNGGICPACNG